MFGLSSQASSDQRQHAGELRLPLPLLSDAELRLSETPGLPTFEFHGQRYFRRVTLILIDGSIDGALYPVFPPDQAAAQALDWLREHGQA
jgi:peroxiredoxin